MRAVAPAALVERAPGSAPSAADGARLDLARNPTRLLTEVDLAGIRRLLASAEPTAAAEPTATPERTATPDLQPSIPRAGGAQTPGAARPRARSPWAWLWAIWEGAAALYVALTEPRRRGPRQGHA